MKWKNRIYTVLALFLIFGIFFYMYYHEGTLPVDRVNPATKIFIVKPGEGIYNIIKNLESENLIRNKIVFFLVVRRLGLEQNIQAGDFRLSTGMSAYEIAETLTHGTTDIWVTFIEGTRKEEMAQLVTQNFNIPSSEFNKEAQEGYLFPDTYLIPRDATAAAIISIMEKNFQTKFAPDLQRKILAKGLTLREGVILASIVEKEANSNQDRAEVAGILLKRLKNDWPLQSDVTLEYALGYQPDEKTWWKKNLTANDLALDSPYNTRLNKGLPPGPICNPSLSSLQAVAEANPNTPYWFYLSDKNGAMHYATTIEEHNANIKKYLQ